MFNLVENEFKKRENYSITENGAIGYKSANSALVSLNYQISSLRNSNEEEIITLFDAAFNEDKVYTLKWLFYSRDIREGLGERRLFRICYKRLAELDIDLFYKNLHNICEYGRWDDLISLLGISDITDSHIAVIVMAQLSRDKRDMKDKKPISLLAKWLPSENASSKKTKSLAKKMRTLLELSPRQYRVMLSELREYLRIVEVKMCSNQWEEIDYEKVPSLANLKYKNAFMKHDMERRKEYLESVKSGTKKMNMKVATPVDVVARYTDGYLYVKDYDEALELAWKNLKDINIKDTMVVADGSGSMTFPISNKITALDVAHALAIYTSEHNSKVYKDKYITFSHNPQFVDLSNDKTLLDKLTTAKKYNEMANTNIEAVFDLILNIAIENKVPKNEMIKNILIISDMEFDKAQKNYYNDTKPLSKPLFEEIKSKYEKAGYLLPKLIFWNVNSRTKTIPLIENELGVVLVSGFSQNILKMVTSEKYNPYEVLKEILDDKRYDEVVT